MKTLLFLLITYISLSFSDTTLCTTNAKRYGSQLGVPTSIPDFCKDVLVNSKTFSFSDDNSVKAFGIKNLLYIKLFNSSQPEPLLIKDHFIAGSNTSLSNILSIQISIKHKRVFVLNESQEGVSVLSFFYDVGGNLSPARKLISSKLLNVTKFQLSESQDEIFVFNSGGAEINVFHINADLNGKRPENSIEPIRSFSLGGLGLGDTLFSTFNKEYFYIVTSDYLVIIDKSFCKQNLIKISHKGIEKSSKTNLRFTGNVVSILVDAKVHSSYQLDN